MFETISAEYIIRFENDLRQTALRELAAAPTVQGAPREPRPAQLLRAWLSRLAPVAGARSVAARVRTAVGA